MKQAEYWKVPVSSKSSLMTCVKSAVEPVRALMRRFSSRRYMGWRSLLLRTMVKIRSRLQAFSSEQQRHFQGGERSLAVSKQMMDLIKSYPLVQFRYLYFKKGDPQIICARKNLLYTFQKRKWLTCYTVVPLSRQIFVFLLQIGIPSHRNKVQA